MRKVGKALAGLAGGFSLGGVVGWLVGIAWYELIEVPYANNQLAFMHRDGYLCGAGSALAWLAIPGAAMGALAGAIWTTWKNDGVAVRPAENSEAL